MTDTFLKDIIKRFLVYKELGDKTLAVLNEDELYYRTAESNNSIAIIVKHMNGNMLSRWTNFLTEDGEKSWRQRDAEFEGLEKNRELVLKLWNEGWECLLNTLRSLQPEDLTKTIYIRSEPLIVYDAILRQLAHYPYHVGQIVVIAKWLKKDDWHSLSISKGESQQYLQKMQQKFGKS